jgi:hypothetical protein
LITSTAFFAETPEDWHTPPSRVIPAIPVRTAGHLLLALVTTGYILIDVRTEERDLMYLFGDQYRAYWQKVRTPLAPADQHAGPESGKRAQDGDLGKAV